MKLLKLDDLIDYYPETSISYKYFRFNGGENHIQINDGKNLKDQEVIIESSLTNSDKIMTVLLATDALKRKGVKDISLFIPYLPYARQDRVCNAGESLSIKVICDLINSQNYNKVYTLDNHSDVSTSMLNNHSPISLVSILNRIYLDKFYYNKHICFVSPDAGALKKTYKLAQSFDINTVIECSKKRDVKTGNILETIVYAEDLSKYHSCFIIDDICDGGRTFIELGKKLKQKGAKQINLYISHGIFSQGLGVFQNIIDNINTTVSFQNYTTKQIGTRFRLGDFLEGY